MAHLIPARACDQHPVQPTLNPGRIAAAPSGVITPPPGGIMLVIALLVPMMFGLMMLALRGF